MSEQVSTELNKIKKKQKYHLYFWFNEGTEHVFTERIFEKKRDLKSCVADIPDENIISIIRGHRMQFKFEKQLAI